MLKNLPVVTFVPTTQFTRARDFYEQTLGLPLVSQDDFALVFALSHASLRVVKVEAFTPAPFTILGWDVPSMDAGLKTLSAKGVTFQRYPFMDAGSDAWTSPSGAKVAWFKDPDGNTLSLTEHPR